MSSNQNLVNQQIKIDIVKRNGKQQTTEVKPLTVHGQVGQDIIITPHDYLPDGYYTDSADRDQTLHFNADSSVTPDHVKFIYDRQQSHSPSLGLITVHYQNSKRPGYDINSIRVHKPVGQPFALDKYKRNLPAGTYLIKVAKGVKQFKKRAQDVIILVRRCVKALLIFENPHERIIEKRPLLSHYSGSTVPYSKLRRRYVPAGYRFVKWGPHRKTLHPNDVDIMVVKRVAPRPKVSASKGSGKILINYADHNRIVDRHVETGQVGQPFDLHYYCHHLPDGYRFVKLATGANVHQFIKGVQLLWIEVAH